MRKKVEEGEGVVERGTVVVAKLVAIVEAIVIAGRVIRKRGGERTCLGGCLAGPAPNIVQNPNAFGRPNVHPNKTPPSSHTSSVHPNTF